MEIRTISPEKFESIEFNLISKHTLRFQDFINTYPNLKSFFQHFYEIESKHNTLAFDCNDIYHLFCHRGKFARSLKDIFNICKHYYPSTTLEKFLIMLGQCDLVGHYCGDIETYCIADQQDYSKGGWDLCNPKYEVSDFLGYTMIDLLNYVGVEIKREI